MIDRPKELTATRIIGLTISKKTLVGGITYNETGFTKRRFFKEKIVKKEKLTKSQN